MSHPYLADAEALAQELTATRRDLHMHPEMGFEEVRTAGIVADRLNGLGYEVVAGVGKTGVVGLLQGGQPGDRTVLLRFDMDALPIEEANDVPYRSQTPGVMHACGHDAHVAIGLGVADVLAKHKDQLPGTIKLMFQPAEEGLGGALAMIEDGVIDRIGPPADRAIGLHVSSQHPLGTAAMRVGPMMAAGARLTITVHGKGGHGAMPHQTVDAVVVASQIVNMLQTIMARNVDPEDIGVVTIGSIHAGEAGNVIAESAVMQGTIRSFTAETKALLRRRVPEIAEMTAAALGATVTVEISEGIDATVNAEAPTLVMADAARALLGADNVSMDFRTTGGEDFSAVLARVPGNYFFLGARNDEKGINAPHHNPRFDIDEACLPQGVAILCDAATRILHGEG
ncbi:amidohydrolase [bacterium]|nr:amidohydrolase [bacterium]